MKRSLVLAIVTTSLLAGGLASSASAAPSSKRHIVCVMETPDQDGFCVTLVLPVSPQD